MGRGERRDVRDATDELSAVSHPIRSHRLRKYCRVRGSRGSPPYPRQE
jgi:hypothetical protein